MILLALLATSAAQGKIHAFTGGQGESIPGELVAVRDGQVIVKRSDGKVFSIDESTLPPTDRVYVQKWQVSAGVPKDATATTESDIEITVALAPATATEKNPTPDSYIPTVSLRNRETQENFKGLKGTLFLIGQAADNHEKFKVLAVEKFSGNLPAQGEYDFAGRPSKGTAAGQTVYHYRGYLFVLQNAEDNIIQFRHFGPLVKTGSEALKLKAGAVFLVRSPLSAARPRTTASPAPKDLWGSQTSILPLHVQP